MREYNKPATIFATEEKNEEKTLDCCRRHMEIKTMKNYKKETKFMLLAWLKIQTLTHKQTVKQTCSTPRGKMAYN